MQGNFEYHFSVLLEFYNDVDVQAIEKQLGIKAHKLKPLSQAKQFRKTATIWYKSNNFNDVMAGEKFDEFVLNLKDKFHNLATILKDNNGECGFSIVFTHLTEFPCISLSKETISTLNNWGADFSVDFLQ